MKAEIIELRNYGVALGPGEYRRCMPRPGELEVCETRENSFNRIIRLARLKSESGAVLMTLYDVHILRFNDNKMGLSGFERKEVDGKQVDYAQSWLCLLNEEHTRDNENMKPPRESFRH